MIDMKNIHKDYLKNVDIMELDKKIREFRKLDLRKIPDSEIGDLVNKTLSVNNNFVYIAQNSIYPKGTEFFRVREIKSLSDLKTEDDFWNPPAQFVKSKGRLNKEGESLLYTAPMNPYVAISESKIEKDAYFILNVYVAKSDIKVNCIGAEYDYNKLGISDTTLIMINDRINDFLREEFMRDVGKGTEYLYKTSESIAKWYFDLPPKIMQDAWCYPSIYSKSHYNVCFRPDIGKELLMLKGVLICKNSSVDDNAINVLKISHGFDKDGKPVIHDVGSDIQKKIFPEIC